MPIARLRLLDNDRAHAGLLDCREKGCVILAAVKSGVLTVRRADFRELVAAIEQRTAALNKTRQRPSVIDGTGANPRGNP